MKLKAIRNFLLALGVSLSMVVPSVSYAAEPAEPVSVQAETEDAGQNTENTDPDTGDMTEEEAPSETPSEEKPSEAPAKTPSEEKPSETPAKTPSEEKPSETPAKTPSKDTSSDNDAEEILSETPDENTSEETAETEDETEDEADSTEQQNSDGESYEYTYIKNLRKDFERIDKVYALANVSTYLNVREEASASARVVGELSPNALCYIIEDADQEWVYIESGDVRGFVKAEYLITGAEAEMYVEITGEDMMETATIVVEPEENEAFDYVKKTVYNPVLNVKGEEIVSYAKQFVGNPYVWGGNSLTEGIDCSHFVWQVLTNCGVYDGDYYTSYGWRTLGEEVESLAEAQAGDIICYEGHVAIYDGEGKIVEAQGKKNGITYGRDADYREILTIRRFTPETVSIDGYETEYLGNFRLTAYCSCSICCGRWANGYTASGVKPVAGRTIALASSTMKRLGLQFGDQIYLRGHIYTIEDHGGSEMAFTNDGLCIDIYCNTHAECFNAMYGGYDDAYKILCEKTE